MSFSRSFKIEKGQQSSEVFREIKEAVAGDDEKNGAKAAIVDGHASQVEAGHAAIAELEGMGHVVTGGSVYGHASEDGSGSGGVSYNVAAAATSADPNDR